MKLSDLDALIPQPVLESGVKPRWGAVTQASPLRVKLDGDDTALPVTPATLVSGLTVGDRVWCLLAGRQIVILGVWGGIPLPEAADLSLYALTEDLGDYVKTVDLPPAPTVPEIRRGTVNLTSSDVTSVTFVTAMSGTPTVVITPNTTTTGAIAGKVRNVSSTGFSATIGGTVTGSIAFGWLAVWT